MGLLSYGLDKIFTFKVISPRSKVTGGHDPQKTQLGVSINLGEQYEHPAPRDS